MLQAERRDLAQRYKEYRVDNSSELHPCWIWPSLIFSSSFMLTTDDKMTDEPRLRNSQRYEKTLSIHLSQKPLCFPLPCVYTSSWRHFCPWAQDFPPVMIFATSNFVRLTFLFSSMFASACEYSLVNRCGRGGGLSGQAVERERERHEVCLKAVRRLFAFMVVPQ